MRGHARPGPTGDATRGHEARAMRHQVPAREYTREPSSATLTPTPSHNSALQHARPATHAERHALHIVHEVHEVHAPPLHASHRTARRTHAPHRTARAALHPPHALHSTAPTTPAARASPRTPDRTPRTSTRGRTRPWPRSATRTAPHLPASQVCSTPCPHPTQNVQRDGMRRTHPLPQRSTR